MADNRLLSESDLWFSPSQMREGAKNALLYPFRNPEQTAEFGLSMAPGSGEAMAARDAWNASGRAGNALLSGDIGQAASEYGNVATGILGAIPGAGIIARGTKRGAAWMDRNLPAGVNKLLDRMTPQASQDTLYAIPAWHGSPHDFDEFKLDKIGTGEGAQAYGHGLYFAETPEVARHYRDALSSWAADGKPLGERLSIELGAYGGNVDELLNLRQEQLAKWIASGQNDKKAQSIVSELNKDIRELNALKNKNIASQGRLYHTELDVEPEDLLDWDKPLSEQPKAVREFAEASDSPVVKAWKKSGTFDRHTGADLYKVLGHRDQGALSRQLRDAGVPGIRYADQHSRFGDALPENQTRNFVIFDDRLVKILGKE